MSRPLKPAATGKPMPFFFELSPLAASLLLFGLGLAAITVFYVSVFMAAHAVAASAGSSRHEFGIVGAWVCGLFLLQGLFPLVRFSIRDLPRIAAARFRLKWRDWALFGLLLVISAFLFAF